VATVVPGPRFGKPVAEAVQVLFALFGDQSLTLVATEKR
jgi:hypothetical protein